MSRARLKAARTPALRNSVAGFPAVVITDDTAANRADIERQWEGATGTRSDEEIAKLPVYARTEHGRLYVYSKTRADAVYIKLLVNGGSFPNPNYRAVKKVKFDAR